MKRILLILMLISAAGTWAAAQLREARESITEDAYQEAIDEADDRSVKFSERTTSVSKDYSSAILTKTVSEVFESTPGGPYRLGKITELIRKGTEREEKVSVGRKQYQRIDNGPWRIPSLSNFAMVESPPGKKLPVMKGASEFFRIRAERAGEPDVYIWEQSTTMADVSGMIVHKYSILCGLITAFEYTSWQKTPENITRTEIRKYEHGVKGIKITLPVLTGRKGR